MDTMQSLTIKEQLEGEEEGTKSNTVERRRITMKASEYTGGWQGAKGAHPN